MPKVELLYFSGCPNVDAARLQIQTALQVVGLDLHWHECDTTAPDAPPQTRGFGSPTILVDGADVTGAPVSGGPSCRLYPGGHGAPPLAAIVGALRESLDRDRVPSTP